MTYRVVHPFEFNGTRTRKGDTITVRELRAKDGTREGSLLRLGYIRKVKRKV